MQGNVPAPPVGHSEMRRRASLAAPSLTLTRRRPCVRPRRPLQQMQTPLLQAPLELQLELGRLASSIAAAANPAAAATAALLLQAHHQAVAAAAPDLDLPWWGATYLPACRPTSSRAGRWDQSTRLSPLLGVMPAVAARTRLPLPVLPVRLQELEGQKRQLQLRARRASPSCPATGKGSGRPGSARGQRLRRSALRPSAPSSPMSLRVPPLRARRCSGRWLLRRQLARPAAILLLHLRLAAQTTRAHGRIRGYTRTRSMRSSSLARSSTVAARGPHRAAGMERGPRMLMGVETTTPTTLEYLQLLPAHHRLLLLHCACLLAWPRTRRISYSPRRLEAVIPVQVQAWAPA